MTHESRTSGVKTLDRAIAILSLFQPEEPEWQAAEVARELGLTLPTVSRLMRALADQGLLMRMSGRRFRLGFAAMDLGMRALQSIEIRERFRPVLVNLARETGETTVLGVVNESRHSAQVIDRVEGRDVIRITLDIGHMWPLHAGALAKALLAHMPDREQLLEQPLERLGKNTIVDRQELEEELAAIRKRGWATSAEETDSGAWGVAKAVLDESGFPVAAILLIAPMSRHSSESVSQLAEQLVAAAGEAQGRLGMRAPRGSRSA